MPVRAFILSFLILSSSSLLMAQQYIGKSKDDVRQLVAEYQKELTEDTSVKNPDYDMIKYSDRFDNQTVLFVFDNGLCSYSKRICDYSLMKEVTKELDAVNTRANDTTWYYQADGNEYIIRLKKEKWFFVINTRKMEQ